MNGEIIVALASCSNKKDSLALCTNSPMTLPQNYFRSTTHKFKHYPYSVIMKELGIAKSTVLNHIVKAMEHCRRRMQELLPEATRKIRYDGPA
jgi:hypothetical protein